eukprot:6771964-Prymnesium_polylepis.1
MAAAVPSRCLQWASVRRRCWCRAAQPAAGTRATREPCGGGCAARCIGIGPASREQTETRGRGARLHEAYVHYAVLPGPLLGAYAKYASYSLPRSGVAGLAFVAMVILIGVCDVRVCVVAAWRPAGEW